MSESITQAYDLSKLVLYDFNSITNNVTSTDNCFACDSYNCDTVRHSCDTDWLVKPENTLHAVENAKRCRTKTMDLCLRGK